MRVDLDRDHRSLSDLPRFQQAPLHERRLRRLTTGIGIAVPLVLLAAVVSRQALPESVVAPLLGNAVAALLLLIAGLYSAFRVARWRRCARRAPTVQSRQGSAVLVLSLGLLRSEALGLCLLTGFALLLVVLSWHAAAIAVASLPGLIAPLLGGTMLLAAFGLLVLERGFADAGDSGWPEAAALVQLARVAIVVLLLGALSLFLHADGGPWPFRLQRLSASLVGVVALELWLRAALSAFDRRGGRMEPRLLADSAVAGLLCWPPRSLHTLQGELQVRLGIDLRQSWAFSFMRRALLPVTAALMLLGCALSGVTEVPIQERGIYERFGAPVAVWAPGLHFGLPWPLGRVRPVENGIVHQVAASLRSEGGDESDLSGAEGPAPESANRLWDTSHLAENSQVIASETGGSQGFEVISMDVRFVYRIALDDRSALAATYNSADIPALIRSIAGRVLVRDLASRDLDGLLGGQRAQLAREIGKTVQDQLDALSSGVEILSSLIESIHPPAGAADAYHRVQAALIKSRATVARERGRAAEQTNDARMRASMAGDKAAAAAREAQAEAEVADLRFAAEREAFKKAGKAFVLEQYLARLSQGLSTAQVVIVDHRLDTAQAPVIDWRLNRMAPDAATLP